MFKSGSVVKNNDIHNMESIVGNKRIIQESDQLYSNLEDKDTIINFHNEIQITQDQITERLQSEV